MMTKDEDNNNEDNNNEDNNNEDNNNEDKETKDEFGLGSEIILSGGHFATICFLGCIQNLIDKENFDLKKVNRWVCTSGGCVVALFLSLGYVPIQIREILKKIPISKISPIDANVWLQFFDNFGLHDTIKIRSLFKHFITHRSLNENITFGEFYKLFDIELVFMSYCLNTTKLVELSRLETPDLKIMDGLCMAIAAPFLFKPVKYHNHLFIDAVVSSNCPVSYSRNKGNAYVFKIEKPTKYYDKIDLLTYSKILVSSMIKQIEDMEVMERNNYGRLFNIQCNFEIDSNLDISIEKIDELFYNGYEHNEDNS